MNIKRTVATVTGMTGLLALLVIEAAAQYGHPGVHSDPTPLVQAKRPRRPTPRTPARANSPAQPPGRASAATNNNQPPAQVAQQTAIETRPPATSVPVSKADPVPTPAPTSTPAPTPRGLTFEDQLARAEQADDRGEARGAAEAYRQALALKPDSPDAHWGLADALYDLRDYTAAISEYQAAIAAGAH